METYVIQVVCNFDDVVIGCYTSRKQAMRRGRLAAAYPDIRLKYLGGIGDTEPLFVRVLTFSGAKEIGFDNLDLVKG